MARTSVGAVTPWLVTIILLVTAIWFSPRTWRVWRGDTNDIYTEENVLPAAARVFFTRSGPSIGVVLWGASLFYPLAFLARSTSAEWIDIGVFSFMVLVGIFGIFAYTAANFSWPRFVLPADDRARYRPVWERLTRRRQEEERP